MILLFMDSSHCKKIYLKYNSRNILLKFTRHSIVSLSASRINEFEKCQ